MKTAEIIHTKKPLIIVICGPTGSGKTDLAIETAEAFNTEIINADSRQLYIETNAGVAKPDAGQLNRVKHHFVNHLSIRTNYSAAEFARDARLIISKIIGEKNVVVVSGGTGLYLKALLHGLDDLPPANLTIRAAIEENYKVNGLTGLQNWLMQLDPQVSEKIDTNNPARIRRAIEIVLSGKAYENSLQTRTSVPWPFLIFSIDWPRSELYERINHRVDKMMDSGLLEEAKRLLPYRDSPALNTIGYSELFNYFDDKSTLKEAIEKIKQHTRNFAKRQITWFKNQESCISLQPQNSFTQLINYLKEHGYILD